MRTVDATVHEAVADALPRLASHIGHESALAKVVDLASQIAAEAPDAAKLFADRLLGQPALIADAEGLRRWAVHGLRRHRDDAGRRIAYFVHGDPHIFFDDQTKSDTQYLLERRWALLLYLAGFGVVCDVDLHEPRGEGETPLSLSIDKDVIRIPRRLVPVELAPRDVFVRAMLAHAAAHLRHSPLARDAGNRRPVLLALMALIEDARAERLMALEHPGLWRVWDLFHTASKEASGHDLPGLMARLARALHDADYTDTNPWVRNGRELFEEAAARDLADVAAFDRLARTLAIGIGGMRLTLPPDYRPAPAYRDDNAILWNPNLALPVDEDAKADIEILTSSTPQDATPIEDLAGIDLRRRYLYPEWDHRLEALREDWTTVIEEPPGQHPLAEERPALASANGRQRLGSARIPDRSIRLTRRAEGDEVDLNAAVENVVQRRSGLAPDGRIFCDHGRRRRSTAIVLLMDLSTSTDRFVPGSFTKVLDLEKQAATVVVEGLDAERDRIAVHGFSSNGRHEVYYRSVKDFDEPFGSRQRARLSALKSSLSTRMGAALRHATKALDAEVADHKLILVLTDGEPSDIDVVEEDYLVEDAREAVVRAASRKVRTFCLTLDRRADHYVRRIFGTRNFMIVDRASAFTESTNRTLVRLLAP